MTKQPNRTYVFIDATNIFYGASKFGWKVDFAKLIKYLKERFCARRVLYFGGVDKENIKQMKFYRALTQLGYELRLVPVKTFSDGKKKADVDSRMTFEMMLYFKDYDQAVVMSGDGDFFWVLEYLCRTKERIVLISHSRKTAHELKKLFRGLFTDFAKMRKLIEKN